MTVPAAHADWLKMKNANARAVKREEEDEWDKKKRRWQEPDYDFLTERPARTAHAAYVPHGGVPGHSGAP
jgi:hypothetical protein